MPQNSIDVNAPVTSHSGAPYRLFSGYFEQKSYVHSPSRTGPVRRHTNFASPYVACIVLMHAL